MEHSPIVPSTSAEVSAALLSAPTVSKVQSCCCEGVGCNLPFAFQFFAGLTVVLYLLAQLVPSLESILAIKATNTYGAHSYIWNVFTAGFFNTSIILVMIPFLLLCLNLDGFRSQAIFLALTFLIMGRWLVPSWGSAEFVKYVFFSNLCVGLSVFISQIVYYMASFNYKYLEMPISGGIGIIAALIVTIKQKLPEEPIILFGQPFMNFCAKDIPGILVILWPRAEAATPRCLDLLFGDPLYSRVGAGNIFRSPEASDLFGPDFPAMLLRDIFRLAVPAISPAIHRWDERRYE
eukprot:762513-Hanusia_phi.AAC.3